MKYEFGISKEGHYPHEMQNNVSHTKEREKKISPVTTEQ